MFRMILAAALSAVALTSLAQAATAPMELPPSSIDFGQEAPSLPAAAAPAMAFDKAGSMGEFVFTDQDPMMSGLLEPVTTKRDAPVVTPSPTPIPAAGLLFVGAAALAGLRRKVTS